MVSFKYRADTPESARDEHRIRLKALSAVAGVIALVVGEDTVRSPPSYDTGLIVVLQDRAALDAYQRDPQHVPVAQFGASICEHIVSVDF